jgi:hypothetical protein
MNAPALSPPEKHTRLMRSFAQREDAERARDLLADSGIGSTLRDLPARRNDAGSYTGCTLSVAPEDAAATVRLLLKMPPSEAPSTSRKPAAAALRNKEDNPTRLRRRISPPVKQRGSFLMIGIACAAAAAMIIFAAREYLIPKRKGTPPRVANYYIEEDLDGDGLPDAIREFTPRWELLYHAEDRDRDGEIDLQWRYQKGRPTAREADLNFDGDFDERTTYDPEGQPFFTDLRPGGRGALLRRTIHRHGLVWKILEDRDADNHFDHLRELDQYGAIARDEALPPGSPENDKPPWPPPLWPEAEEPKILTQPPPPRQR